ncbi:hypothetical protein I4641_23430 [Waterburya agarophytonicola K14]|uniref:Uncharacterized protein n=1 Tax=Waterburya agarophytonicola KI4 TaxID=2874699 RepID=A0A964FIH7_9CYAN|nr:hypothetical protein [Waterburya agarophytonicola]MCC0179892.1 hypothetical protein [Waterburya agarophytonicola KI4]
MTNQASGWGGKRGEYYKGRGGQPQKYDDPVEIRIRCDRSWRDRLDSYLEQHDIKSRNQWLIDLIDSHIDD